MPRPCLRKAARIADRMGAPWYAVYVQTPRESPEHIDAATQRKISNNLELARQLGGTSLAFKGGSGNHHRFVRQGIRHHPHCHGPQPPALVSPLVRPSILDHLMQAIPGVDVIVVDNSPSTP